MLTPRTPQDLIEGFLASRALTSSGSLPATPAGGFLPNQAPRSFCFWGVLGGYLRNRLSDLGVAVGRAGQLLHMHSPLNRGRIALEPVRDKDFVLLVLAGRKDVGALDCLLEVTEDVVDDDDSLGGVGRARHI